MDEEFKDPEEEEKDPLEDGLVDDELDADLGLGDNEKEVGEDGEADEIL